MIRLLLCTEERHGVASAARGTILIFLPCFFDTVRRRILVIIVVPANRYSCFLGRAFFFFIPAQKRDDFSGA